MPGTLHYYHRSSVLRALLGTTVTAPAQRIHVCVATLRPDAAARPEQRCSSTARRSRAWNGITAASIPLARQRANSKVYPATPQAIAPQGIWQWERSCRNSPKLKQLMLERGKHICRGADRSNTISSLDQAAARSHTWRLAGRPSLNTIHRFFIFQELWIGRD